MDALAGGLNVLHCLLYCVAVLVLQKPCHSRLERFLVPLDPSCAISPKIGPLRKVSSTRFDAGSCDSRERLIVPVFERLEKPILRNRFDLKGHVTSISNV